MKLLKRASSNNSDFQKLIVELDNYLKIIDGAEHPFYAQFNKVDSIKNVVLCYGDGLAIGCGAFKSFDIKSIEIKRMFVNKNWRRQGVGSMILNELEIWAKELNYLECVLETGKKQIDAIQLYKNLGYKIIPNFGHYKNIENSLCMKKILI